MKGPDACDAARLGCACSTVTPAGGVKDQSRDDALDAPPPETPRARKERKEEDEGVGALERRHVVSRASSTWNWAWAGAASLRPEDRFVPLAPPG